MLRHPLSRSLLAFAIAFAALLIAPAFMGELDGPRTGMTAGDTLDLFTPLVLIPLYVLLFRQASSERASPLTTLLFVLMAALWVEGQGIHLAANSVANAFTETSAQSALLTHASGNDPQSLTHFYDETLGHYLWHGGILGLSALVLGRARNASQAAVGVVPFLASGALYGATFFLVSVEGGTVPMGLPAAALLAATGLWRWRSTNSSHPILLHFTGGYLIALALFAAWGIWQGGFPQFTQVGYL